MKQHITPKQAQEVSKEQFYSAFEELVNRKDWATYHHKKMTIGKMMEILKNFSVSSAKGNVKWTVYLPEERMTFQDKELVNALWKAVKYKLN